MAQLIVYSEETFLSKVRSMIQRRFDISVNHPCVQSNPSMELLFDILTPRPHFIIIQREECRKLNATDSEMRDVMELVTEFLTHKSEYDHQAILAFHRGTWYQQNHKHFHAHLCVSKKPYCHDAKITIDETCHLSSRDYLNRLHRDFLLSKIKYSHYRNQCLSKAFQCFNDPVSYKVPLEQFNTSKFTLVYHASSPRIGVLAKTCNTDLKVLFDFLNQFYFSARQKLSSINPLFENFGAHLCIYVSGKKSAPSHLTERADRALMHEPNSIQVVPLVGYIQMDEQLYLRWLPAAFHRLWLNQFERREHLVLT